VSNASGLRKLANGDASSEGIYCAIRVPIKTDVSKTKPTKGE
jgi:hypothetical protein